MVERKAFLTKSKHQYRASQRGKHDYNAHNKRLGDYYENSNLTYFMDELWLQEKWWKIKPFLQIQSINIMYCNEENMIDMPITKGMEMIMRIRVWLIPWININCKENSGKKSFSYKSKALISCIPKRRTWLWCP